MENNIANACRIHRILSAYHYLGSMRLRRNLYHDDTLETVTMQGTLHFHTFAEKAPEHGQDIFYFRSRLGGFIEPKFATVKCFWVEYDNMGKLTGNSWSYDADKSELPDNCRLAFGTDDVDQLCVTDYWCSFSSIENMIDGEQIPS